MDSLLNDPEIKNQLDKLGYPSTTIEAVSGREGDPVQSIVQIADNIAGIIGKFNKGFQQKYCMAKLNAFSYLGMLGDLAGNIVGAALDIANRIMKCVGSTIIGAINRIMGSIFGIMDAIENFVYAIDALFDKLLIAIGNLVERGINALRKFLEQEDCEHVLAEMSQCAVSKMLHTSKLEQKANKLIGKMYQTGASIHDAITEEIASDTDSLANWIDKQSFMANKAAYQLYTL